MLCTPITTPTVKKGIHSRHVNRSHRSAKLERCQRISKDAAAERSRISISDGAQT